MLCTYEQFRNILLHWIYDNMQFTWELSYQDHLSAQDLPCTSFRDISIVFNPDSRIDPDDIKYLEQVQWLVKWLASIVLCVGETGSTEINVLFEESD
jgi:hypothetical protein